MASQRGFRSGVLAPSTPLLRRRAGAANRIPKIEIGGAAVIRATSLSCQNAAKVETSTPVRASSGESRMNPRLDQ
jgi:hypothetical protein